MSHQVNVYWVEEEQILMQNNYLTDNDSTKIGSYLILSSKQSWELKI